MMIRVDLSSWLQTYKLGRKRENKREGTLLLPSAILNLLESWKGGAYSEAWIMAMVGPLDYGYGRALG